MYRDGDKTLNISSPYDVLFSSIGRIHAAQESDNLVSRACFIVFVHANDTRRRLAVTLPIKKHCAASLVSAGFRKAFEIAFAWSLEDIEQAEAANWL